MANTFTALLLTVLCSGMLSAQAPVSRAHLIGRFSTLRLHEETGDVLGEALLLFQEGDRIFGTFTSAEGEARSAPIENATISPATGEIYFECWMTTGSVGDGGSWKPCRSFFQGLAHPGEGGLSLRLRERSFWDGAESLKQGWSRDFSGVKVELLPVENEGFDTESAPSYFSWILTNRFPRVVPDCEGDSRTCSLNKATPAESRSVDPAAAAFPKSQATNLLSRVTWERALSLPVFILVTAAFLVGVILTWAMIRLCRSA